MSTTVIINIHYTHNYLLHQVMLYCSVVCLTRTATAIVIAVQTDFYT